MAQFFSVAWLIFSAMSSAWIARQYLRRFCGLGVPVSHLTIASLAMVCLSVVLTVLYFGFAAIPDPSGLVGVVAGTAIIWSDRHRGGWSSLGLGLSLLYLGASIGTPVYLGISVVKGLVYLATGYGPVALGSRGARGMEHSQMETGSRKMRVG